MDEVVGVYFANNSKVYFFNSNGLKLNDGDYVIVEIEKGVQLGRVIIGDIKNKEVLENMNPILRVATKDDIRKFEKNRVDSLKALNRAKKIANKLNLNMNLIDATFTFDRSQLMFFFLADQRVDFREMAKELASIYKTRIELRQIGVRDKARVVSGIGQCGRELCCSCFLKESMESVTINMAKNQNIALNPNKINGQCGRLLCCLNYEDDVYTENRKGMPNIGDLVSTDKGKGKVVSLDIIKRSYVVNIPDEGRFEIFLEKESNECKKM